MYLFVISVSSIFSYIFKIQNSTQELHFCLILSLNKRCVEINLACGQSMLNNLCYTKKISSDFNYFF